MPASTPSFRHKGFDLADLLLLDSQLNPLIPGRLYCLATVIGGGTGELSYGSLAWWGSDGQLYDANSSDAEGAMLDEDFDVLVLQVGNVNPLYLFH